jgi:hypothetical protein
MKKVVMERDEKGRFTGEAPDPEQLRKWAEDDKRAEAAAKACERMDLPLEFVGLKRFEETGHWWFGHETRVALLAAFIGIAYGMKSIPDDEKTLTILSIVEGLGLEDSLLGKIQKAYGKSAIDAA